MAYNVQPGPTASEMNRRRQVMQPLITSVAPRGPSLPTSTSSCLSRWQPKLRNCRAGVLRAFMWPGAAAPSPSAAGNDPVTTAPAASAFAAGCPPSAAASAPLQPGSSRRPPWALGAGRAGVGGGTARWLVATAAARRGGRTRGADGADSGGDEDAGEDVGGAAAAADEDTAAAAAAAAPAAPASGGRGRGAGRGRAAAAAAAATAGASSAPTVERIEDVELTDELYNSYGTYAMSVIVSRAIPDVRDGLKPVHRRILYAMHELGLAHNKPFKKCARVVGEVLGKFHPHGDAAVYESLVRMAQPFAMRETLVDGHGNFGSVDDDPPAAMRYTECRLTSLASDTLLRDLAHRETVGWRPTFDDSQSEPEVLPAVVPNLLVNGTHGIAVGLASSMPPHNLGEVVAALRALIADPGVTTAQLLTHVLGPDFPTGGELLVGPELVQAYETGSGSFVLRGKAEIEGPSRRKAGAAAAAAAAASSSMDEDDGYGGSGGSGGGGREQIVITELPYGEYKAKLVSRIAGLMDDKKLEGVSDVRDESDRTGLRVVVEVKRGYSAEMLLGQLYKLAGLERRIQLNMMCLSGSKPVRMGLKQLLQTWLDFRCGVVSRRSSASLLAAQQRAHLVEGFLRLLQEPGLRDAVLADVVGAADGPAARRALEVQRGFSGEQAEAILDRRMRGLTAMEAGKLKAELEELKKTISYLQNILNDRSALLGVVEAEAVAVAEAYPDPRRTQVQAAADVAPPPDPELLAPAKPCLLLATRKGFLRRLGTEAVAAQHRNTRGKSGIKMRSGDSLAGVVGSLDRDELLLFTPGGKAFQTKVAAVPSPQQAAGGAPATSSPSGTSVANVLRMDQSFPIAAVLPIPRTLAPVGATRSGPAAAAAATSAAEEGTAEAAPQTADGPEAVAEAAAAAEAEAAAGSAGPAGPSIVLCSRRGAIKRIAVPATKLSRSGLTVANFGATWTSDTDDDSGNGTAGDGEGDDDSQGAAAKPTGRRPRRVASTAAADELGWAALVDSPEDVLVLVTAEGQGLLMRADDVRLMGRASGGVKGIALGSKRRPNDALADVAVVPAEVAALIRQPGAQKAEGEEQEEEEDDASVEDEETAAAAAAEEGNATAEGEEGDRVPAGPCLFVVTAHGLGKRVPLSELSLSRRAHAGQKVIKVACAARARKSKGDKAAATAAAASGRSSRGADRVVAALFVQDGDEIVLASRNGVVVRQFADGVAAQRRTNRGTYVMQLDDGDEVADAVLVPTAGAAPPRLAAAAAPGTMSAAMAAAMAAAATAGRKTRAVKVASAAAAEGKGRKRAKAAA